MKINFSDFSTQQMIREASELINSSRIKTLYQIKQNMDLSWVENKDYRIINTVELLDGCISEMLNYEYIAVDTETTGLNFHDISPKNPIRDTLVGICLSWKENQAIYIPINHVKISNIQLAMALTRLQYILENKSIVTHNGIFDGKVFYSYGIKLNIKHDTMYMQFNIDSEVLHFSKSLKSMTNFVFGYSPIEFEDIFEFEKDYRLFRFVDEDVVRIYGCGDADHTLMLFHFLIKQLNPLHMRGYKKDIEQLVPNVIRSEYVGKSININLLKTLSRINDADLYLVANLIYRYVGTTLCYKQTGELREEYFEFNIGSVQQLSTVVYDLLEYPRSDNKNTSLNKTTLKFLLKFSEDEPCPVAELLMPNDLISNSINYPELGYKAKDHILLSRDKFLSKKNRLILLVELYRTLLKNQGTFFRPLLTNELEGKCFTSINIARAATFRMIDTFQTLDKRLKKVVSPPDGMYMMGYDYAQIEARLMVGLAGFEEMTLQLDNPEADFHRLSASAIEGVRPEQITDDQRKTYKPVNFGIPYGVGPRKITTDKYGIGHSEEKLRELTAKTKVIIENWKVGMKPVWDMLERYRDDALIPLPESEVPYHLKGQTIGRVTSPFGRSRYLNLDNLTESKIASIRRKCGNFPIQCYARDIFVEGFSRLANCLIKEGLMDIKVPDNNSPLGYHFENKVKFMVYVHDEVQMIVDKSINPKWMMKKIYENCVIHIKGHPTYYVGAAIINNWYESKGGEHEVPIVWLQELPDNTPKYAEWNPNIQADIDKECEEYIASRIIEEFNKIGIDITHDVVMTTEKLLEFTSYYLIGKAQEMFGVSYKDVNNKLNYNHYFVLSLEKKFNIKITIKDANVEDDFTQNVVSEVKDYLDDVSNSDKLFEQSSNGELDSSNISDDEDSELSERNIFQNNINLLGGFVL